MKYSNFKLVSAKKIACVWKYKATVDITTGFLFWKKTKTTDITSKGISNWIFNDTGRYTCSYFVEYLVSSLEAKKEKKLYEMEIKL